jgi:hypothetical protein
MEPNLETQNACPCGSGRMRVNCHGGSPIDVRDPDVAISYLCIFGFPEFQESLFNSYKKYFLATLPSVRSLAMEILRQAIPDPGVEAAVQALAAAAFATHLEVVLLAGNGLGFGAAKSARSLLECLFITEYLIRNPEEAERHKAMGDHSLWRILEKAKERGLNFSRFQLDEKELREKHRVARERFASREWNFQKIAKDIGREADYDAVYKTLSELVHSSHLGISLRTSNVQGIDWPAVAVGASDQWCDVSLYLGHKFLIQIFEAVNHLFGLNYSERLAAALSDLEKAWQLQ